MPRIQNAGTLKDRIARSKLKPAFLVQTLMQNLHWKICLQEDSLWFGSFL